MQWHIGDVKVVTCMLTACSYLTGVSAVSRTLANKAIPIVEFIITNNETWTMKTTSTIKNSEINFKLGEEFDETSLDGRKCRVIFTFILTTSVQFDYFDRPLSIIYLTANCVNGKKPQSLVRKTHG